MTERLLLPSMALLASILLTGIVHNHAVKRRLIDVPNARSAHQVPTPRGGGLAIAAVFLSGLTGLALAGRIPVDLFAALFGSGLLVAAIGFLDDHGHVPAHWRLLVHLIAAAWAVAWLGGLDTIPLGRWQLNTGWIGDVMAILFLTWLLNLFNFMDGIDGIAASEAFFATLTTAGLLAATGSGSSAALLPLLLLAAATTGFLLWNWPPARIFMGDVGSGFLGITLGIFALYTTSGEQLNVWVWLILCGVFVVDASWTLLRRILTGERWYEAHSSHAYQRLARRWNSHHKVTVATWLINLGWLLPLAVAAAFRPQLGALCLVVAYVPLLLLAATLGAGRPTS